MLASITCASAALARQIIHYGFPFLDNAIRHPGNLAR
jgi:hypothetical protein